NKVYNKAQLTYLVNSISENPNIGKRFQKENKERVNTYWKKLHESLNSMGPPLKSIAEWKRIG
ncbi:PREDICTED: uncharacterized protein LOC108973608, partial [Bactrocera latifrons]|uniref:uncharacterized protein LOC108973608 n=1 Tax=Bactrocera latifrons TaxID=174628 RepID=UPI0008DC65C5